MKRRVGLPLLLLLLGCGQERLTGPEPQEAPLRASATEAYRVQTVDQSAEAFWREQKLIRTGKMSVEVDSVEQARSDIQAIVAAHDGLLADSEASQDDAGNRRATVAVRVPSARFDAALRDLRQLGKVEREEVATQDVTRAYADLETRLSVMRQTEERLRDLLSSRTGDLAEVLQVERELSRVIGEIEQLLGEKRFYDHRIAISTIEIVLYEARAALRPGVFAPAGEAFANSLSVLAFSVGALVYLLVFVAPWAIVAVAVWWIVTTVRKRKRPGAGS